MKAMREQNCRKKAPILSLALILIMYLPGRVTAQGMPVYDNTNFISLGKQLIESAKQTAELLNMVEELNAVREKIEKVKTEN